MLTIHDKHIILGSIGGASAPVLPDGWGAGWLSPPAVVDNGNGTGAINGSASMVWLLCPAYPDANNKFRWLANATAGNVTYTVKSGDGTVLYAGNTAFNVAFDYDVDYSVLTATADAYGKRQFLVEITPSTPSEAFTSSALSLHVGSLTTTAVDAAILVNPAPFDWRIQSKPTHYTRAITPSTFGAPLGDSFAPSKIFTSTATQIGVDNYEFSTTVIDQKYPNATSFAGVSPLLASYGLKFCRIEAPLVAQSNLVIFGDGTQNNAARSLQICLMPGFRCGFSVRWGDMSASALDDLSNSLGTAYTTGQILDYRNNPGSATCSPLTAQVKGYTVLTT